jgi:lauroyl/myristoyl acyltransferase
VHFQDLTSSEPITRLGIFIGQHMSRRVGYGLARMAASAIACRKPSVYRTVRANLRQIVGPQADDSALHRMARQVFFHAGQTYYDFFQAVGRPSNVLARAVQVPESLISQIKAETTAGRGVLLLASHMSNFDLAGLAVGAHGLPIQALSLANPVSGFRVLNRLRIGGGYEVTPISPESLRAAIRRLEDGGIVVTGVDRPIPQDRTLVEFFGQPAYMPTGPARMALLTGATVLMASCHYDLATGYRLEFTGPIEIVCTGNRRQDIAENTRRLATILERYVRTHPEQWMMFHPFWPNMPDI